VFSALLIHSASWAQIKLAADAETRSVRFQFEGAHEMTEDDLRPQVGTTAPGPFDGVQSALVWTRLVGEPDRHAFNPEILQGDLVRLRRYYRRQGFLDVGVDYVTKPSADRKWVAVTFVVHEGEPLKLASIAVDYADSALRPPPGDPSAARISKVIDSIELNKRFDEAALEIKARQLARSFADAGYAFTTITPRAAIDSVQRRVDLVWILTPGNRSRVATIQVEGLKSVPKHIATRQMGFTVNDTTSRAHMERARQNLQTVDLFRSADVSYGGGGATDSLLPVHVRLSEDHPRFTGAEVGYITDGAGISGQTRWTHPNFTGGARSLSAIALVQTGWATSEAVLDRLVRTTLALTQPFVGSPDWSASFGPSFEWRDGSKDRSNALSGQVTFVRRFNALQAAAFRYEYTYRQVDVSRLTELGASATNVTLAALAGTGVADSLSEPIKTSVFSFSTSIGHLDNIARPRHGMVLKPNLAITAPRMWGNVEFSKADLQLTAFAPMLGKENAIMFRGAAGKLWPWGDSSLQPGENPAVDVLRLRDFLFTAGGSSDVRGYGNRLLGPKVPRVNATIKNGDTTYTSDYYVEVGGFQRWTTTIEARIALPFISRDVFAHVFTDAGRVWTVGPQLQLALVPQDEQRAFYTCGSGIAYYTPVGAIRFDVGYKLNPSELDVRHPQDVVNALKARLPVSTAPVDSFMRYHFHLALGLFF
jgi:outer membrane protein insertion porin family